MFNKKDSNEILNSKEIWYDLKKVKNYLDNHPLSSILEVNQKTNVSIGEILIFIKKGFIKIRQLDKTFIAKKNY